MEIEVILVLSQRAETKHKLLVRKMVHDFRMYSSPRHGHLFYFNQ